MGDLLPGLIFAALVLSPACIASYNVAKMNNDEM